MRRRLPHDDFHQMAEIQCFVQRTQHAAAVCLRCDGGADRISGRLGTRWLNGYRRSDEGEGALTWLRLPLLLLVVSLAVIAGVWRWLATPVTLASAPIDPAAKLDCVSYAPFRNQQSPLESTVRVSARQIAEDLAQLAKITRCIRTYSVDNGLDQVPALAREAGLKMIFGIWLSSDRLKNRIQIDTAVPLIKDFPDVIESVVVGNEVLLRGEMTASELVANLRTVKTQVGRVPVTYADVWEFWLRHREIYDAVDFLTIHILPYWEDFPIRARFAAMHVDSIRKRIAAAFPGKDILIGETGWPSAGRMRDDSLPSRTNQARVVSEILDLARRENFRVNLIEAYDQPWKRRLEGTVGGYWGLIGNDPRTLKYPAGEPISDFLHAKAAMIAGLIYSVVVFGAALLTQRRRPWKPHWSAWIAIALSATCGGALLGIAVDKMLVESLGTGGWLQWGALLAAASLAPVLASIAQVTGRPLPAFQDLIGPKHLRDRSALAVLLGVTLAITILIAVQSALGFVFDPRYRDFPFAALTMAAVPLLGLALLNRRPQGERPASEMVIAGLLVLSSGYIAINEGFANWQSLWTCAAYVALGLTMWQARAVRGQE